MRSAGAWLQIGSAVALLSLANTAAAAQSTSDAQELEIRAPGAQTGPSLALGIGHGYGLFGAQLSYPVTLGSGFALGPFVGAGGLPPLGEAEGHWTFAGGLLAYWGTRHRLFLESSIAPVAVWLLELHGTFVATDPDYGPAAILGYEFVGSSGFLARVGGGAGVTFGNDSQVLPLVSVGVGWKW